MLDEIGPSKIRSVVRFLDVARRRWRCSYHFAMTRCTALESSAWPFDIRTGEHILDLQTVACRGETRGMPFAPEGGGMQKTPLLALLTLAVLASQPLQAAHSAQMHVSVEVIARTILSIDSQPSAVEVTTTDVARGYIDLPAAVAFHVRSNARRGYTVQFQPVAAAFTKALVTWGTTTATVGSDESWVAQPYVQGTVAGTMSVRLFLSPAAAPGTYGWPLSIDADSL